MLILKDPPPPAGPGRLIAFEGGEGAGKTTHSRRLHARLQEEGYDTILIREPGGTPLGEHLRGYLKSDRPLTPEAELLLFGAARAELARSVIRPALQRGAIVLTDRYAASTLAYQGAGRGLPAAFIRRVNEFAIGDGRPHLNLLLDLDPALGLMRAVEQASFGINLQEQAAPWGQRDRGRRFDDLPLEVHRRIHHEFQAMTRYSAEPWAIVDAQQPLEQAQEEIYALVAALLPLPARREGAWRPAAEVPLIPEPEPAAAAAAAN